MRRRRALLLRNIERAIRAAGAPARDAPPPLPSAGDGGADSLPPSSATAAAAGDDDVGGTAERSFQRRVTGGGGGPAAVARDGERRATIDGRGTKEQMEKDVQADLNALMQWTRVNDSTSSGEEPAPKRRRGVLAAAAAAAPADARFGTLASQARAHFEARGDWAASAPMVTERAGSKAGKFDSFRLRELQRLMLTIDPSGTSLLQQKKIWNFLNAWDGTRSDMDSAEDDGVAMRQTFPTVTSFQAACKDDIDEALAETGFKKVTMKEDGQSYQAFFLSALDVIIDLVRTSRNVRFWSGPDGPAAPTDARESPLDGDAFRLCEADVAKKGERCCVLGLHLYSDSNQLSWSGGELSLANCAFRVLLVLAQADRWPQWYSRHSRPRDAPAGICTDCYCFLMAHGPTCIGCLVSHDACSFSTTPPARPLSSTQVVPSAPAAGQH